MNGIKKEKYLAKRLNIFCILMDNLNLNLVQIKSTCFNLNKLKPKITILKFIMELLELYTSGTLWMQRSNISRSSSRRKREKKESYSTVSRKMFYKR